MSIKQQIQLSTIGIAAQQQQQHQQNHHNHDHNSTHAALSSGFSVYAPADEEGNEKSPELPLSSSSYIKHCVVRLKTPN